MIELYCKKKKKRIKSFAKSVNPCWIMLINGWTIANLESIRAHAKNALFIVIKRI